MEAASLVQAGVQNIRVFKTLVRADKNLHNFQRTSLSVTLRRAWFEQFISDAILSKNVFSNIKKAKLMMLL